MKELLLMLSSVMSFDEMISMLEADIAKYKANPTEENKKRIQVACSLILSKAAVDESGSGTEGVFKVLDTINNHQKLEKMFNPDKN